MNTMAKALVAVLLLLFALNACGEIDNNKTAPRVKPNNIQPTPPAASTPDADELQLQSKVTEGDFELTVYTEKTHYELDEPIHVYAELVYVGEQEQIEIGHSMSPIGFDISEHTRSYYTMGVMNEPYVVTVLQRNEPVRVDYSFSGGYSSDDQQYIDFVNQLAEGKYLDGYYTISAHAGFMEHLSVEQQQELEQQGIEDTREQYGFTGSISFIVGSGNPS